MFRLSDDDVYQASSEGGVRHLFDLGAFRFHDTLDDEDHVHHFVLETAGDGAAYEVDRDTMYEFMARYLAGLHEVEQYDLDHSPSHDAILDVLEIAAARARAGESDFSWEAIDAAESEIVDEDTVEFYDDEDEDDEEDEEMEDEEEPEEDGGPLR